jgi:transcriptional regulator with XRE-family HTH domain
VPWSDEEFRARVAARAAELGMSLTELLEKAGVSREVFYKVPTTGRRIDTIEKIAEACGWTLGEVMGLEERPAVEIMAAAFASAQRVMAGLPNWARTEALFVEALTYLYEEAMGERRRLRQRSAEDLKALVFAEYLKGYERILIRSLERKNPSSEPTAANSGSARPAK